MKIWLDDERKAPEGWRHCRWPKDVIDLIAREDVEEISLDHDLGDDEIGTGYDVLTWMEETVMTNRIAFNKVPRIHIHTANPVARKRMEQARAKIVQACSV